MRPTGELFSDEVRKVSFGLEDGVWSLLVDSASLFWDFSSSTIVSTVAGFPVNGLGRPAVLSVRGGLGGPSLMIRLRLASFSLEAFTSVDGGVKMSTSGRRPTASLLCSFEKAGYDGLDLGSIPFVVVSSSTTPGMDERRWEPVDDKDVFEADFSLAEFER